ncbi:MAG: D-alanine--D-alanine ligase [Coriobacteriales bacterium]|jgi:D-alanine-D-alanine ligase|nr:D-alanine--D-alanine ligase [Coriobacteriales bacterium]
MNKAPIIVVIVAIIVLCCCSVCAMLWTFFVWQQGHEPYRFEERHQDVSTEQSSEQSSEANRSLEQIDRSEVERTGSVAMGIFNDAERLAEAHRLAATVSDRVANVALLYGGASGEREVSIASGNGVREALEAEGFTVFFIDTGEHDFIDQLCAAKPDVAFIALHGKGGEDGCIQGLLETLGIPYTHSGVGASALAMDKVVSKIVYEAYDLKNARFKVVRKDQAGESMDSILASIGLPCVVKPVSDGSSLGVSIPKTREEFFQALDEGFETGDVLLVEEFIKGVEVTVPVLGNKVDDLFALPLIEIVPKNEFYDYESKYEEGGSEHIIPARITDEEALACRQAAIKAHEVIGCVGVSRTDLIVTAAGTPYLIETNTIPGMTRTSLVPEAAKKAGISPGELYRLLIHYALAAQEG